MWRTHSASRHCEYVWPFLNNLSQVTGIVPWIIRNQTIYILWAYCTYYTYTYFWPTRTYSAFFSIGMLMLKIHQIRSECFQFSRVGCIWAIQPRCARSLGRMEAKFDRSCARNSAALAQCSRLGWIRHEILSTWLNQVDRIIHGVIIKCSLTFHL